MSNEIKGTVATNGTLNGTLQGIYGKDGLSAYEIALQNGFDGTEQEWIASLKGEQGIQGIQGEKGDTGNSGVYVGSGDMPADCNVQIDPNGDAFTLDDYYTKAEVNELPAIACISANDMDITISSVNAEPLFVSYASKGYSQIKSPNGDASISVLNANNISIRTDYGIDVNGSRIIDVAEPEEPTDAATRGYVDGLVGDIETLLGGI
jgi:hypothetical protein